MQVNSRIMELEDKYLSDTIWGNVVKGWEIDGKLLAPRASNYIDDKDRIFTASSTTAWAEYCSSKEHRKMKTEMKKK